MPHERSPTLLPGLLLAVSLHAFHAMAVVTVVPQVVESLDGLELYGAFFSAYLLASLLGLVWAGRAFTLRGPPRVLGVSFAVFGAGVLVSALAPTMEALVLARVAEGFGGGGVSSVLYAIVNRTWAEAERPRVLAWMSSAWVLPGLLGPPLAGMVAETVGWRWVFAGVLPAVAAAAAMVLPALRTTGAMVEPGLRTAEAMVEPGLRTAEAMVEPALPTAGARAATHETEGAALKPALGLAAGTGAILLGIARLDALGVAALGAGVALFVASAHRVLPPGTLSARAGLPAAIASKFLVNFGFFGAEAFIPLALRELHGWSLTLAGGVLTASALTWTTGAFLHSRLAARWPAGLLCALGAAGIAAGIAGIAAVAWLGAPPGFAFPAWALAGLGMGLAYNTTTTSAMEHTAPGREGPTATALGIADALGFALSAGIGGAILAAGDAAGSARGLSIAAICAITFVATSLTTATSLRLGPDRGAATDPALAR